MSLSILLLTEGFVLNSAQGSLNFLVLATRFSRFSRT